MANLSNSWTVNFRNKIQAKLFFRRLGNEASLRAVKVAAKAGVKPIFIDVKRRASTWKKGFSKGKMLRALRVVFTAKRGMARASISPTKKGAHAVFLEYGTKNMEAQPFLRPAMDAKHEEATNIVIKVYTNFIKRLARRGIR